MPSPELTPAPAGVDSFIAEFWRWIFGIIGAVGGIFLTRLTGRYSLIVEKVTRLETQMEGIKEQLDRLENRLTILLENKGVGRG